MKLPAFKAVRRMNIAIDCRYIGKSGIGRVCLGILESLDYTENKYYLIGKPQNLSQFAGAEIIEDNTEPYSKTGLFRFAKKRVNKECDCLIIPNFLVPLGIKVPVHSVMHDLIFLDMKITSKNFADRAVKNYLLKRCMKKSVSVACVSRFTMDRCKYYYKRLAAKCYLNYPGLAKALIEYAQSHTEPAVKENKIIFVGNVKPNKGLKILLSAFEKTEGLTLKIIGERDNFITGLRLDESQYKNVEFTGKISDEQLFEEVRTAKFLVLPSRYEGFGAPPMEALYLNTQPIISDIEVFREVYKDLPVVFFSDENDLALKLSAQPETPDCGNVIAEKFNYKNFAAEILKKLR